MEKNKVQIFIFTQTLLKGGAEKQAVLLANTLNRGYRVNLIVYYGSKLDKTLKDKIDDNILLTTLKGSPLIKFIYLWKLFRNNKNAILFNYLLLPNFIGGLLSKLTGLRYSVGGVRSAVLSKNKIQIERFIHNRLNVYTIFNNKLGIESCVKNGFNRDKCIYIPNALHPIPEAIDRINKDDKTIKILSVGRFEQVKNYPFALSIIKELLKQNIEITYIIIGWGKEEETIRKLISKYGINNSVQVVINPSNLNDYYKGADLFLQTSKFEGLSNTIMEAMSFSIPVIATNVGDNKELIKNDYSGYFISDYNSELFINKINYLIENPEKRIAFGLNAYNRLNANFSLSKFDQNYSDFIKKLNEN